MSIALPQIDLSTAAVGTTGTLDWQIVTSQSSAPVNYGRNTIRAAFGNAPHLYLYNESGCTLQVAYSTGESTVLPAGCWIVHELQPSCTSLTYTVLHVIANAPISMLLAVWYAPSERPPSSAVLGNSPIGGGVANTVSNELKGVGQTYSLTERDFGATLAGLVPTAFNTSLILGSTDPLGNAVEGAFITPLGELTADKTFSVNGVVTALNGDTTVGNGVPSIVAGNGTAGTHVTTTVTSTATFNTAAANGMYSIEAFAIINNAVTPNNITFTVSYTDVNGGARVDTIPLNFSTGTVFPNGATAVANGHYTSPGMTFPTQASSNITITYHDPTNTPNDYYWYIIKRYY